MSPVHVLMCRDGLSAEFMLPAPFEAIRGTVRPAAPLELAAYRQRIASASETELVKAQADLICTHIKSWNVADANRALYDVTPSIALSLPDALFVLLAKVAAGTQGVDLLGKPVSCSDSPPTARTG